MNNTLFDSSFSPPQSNVSATAQSLCPGNVPLVLLPVRLETRFFPQAGNQTELRIRIYPDKVHVDSHQRELLADERTAAMNYWQQDWTAMRGARLPILTVPRAPPGLHAYCNRPMCSNAAKRLQSNLHSQRCHRRQPTSMARGVTHRRRACYRTNGQPSFTSAVRSRSRRLVEMSHDRWRWARILARPRSTRR
jgi:hypothetical protein